MVPNRTISRRICTAIRAGQPMDRVCTVVGVDAPTLKRWLALGEAAYRESEEEDPHCWFFKAFVKALEHAERAAEADNPRLDEPEYEPPRRPRREPRRAGGHRSSDHPPLAWLVVEEAPIAIVIGSRPPWVYETPPTSRPGPAPQPTRPTEGGEITISEPESMVPVDEEAVVPRRDPTREELGAILGVLAVGLALLVVVVLLILLVLAMIPVALAGMVLIGTLRLAWGVACRWRAGLIALRGGAFEGLAMPGRVVLSPRSKWPGRRHPRGRIDPDRTAGSVAWSDRLPPQRE